MNTGEFSQQSGEFLSEPIVGIAEKQLKGEDRYYVGSNAYAVLDGVGGVEGGAAAADKVLEIIEASLLDVYLNLVDEAETLHREIFDRARRNLFEARIYGATTATIATIIEQGGEKILSITHAGDCRVYIGNPKKATIRQITKDQGRQHIVSNFIGGGSADNKQRLEDVFYEEFLSPGDVIVMCTDGITGDTEGEALSDEEILACLNYTDPKAAAKALVAISRKQDDKVALVIKV